MERIAKRMARLGLCSRRDAEKWISQGRVIVNGTKLTSPATNVSDSCKIKVDGKLLGKPEGTRLWRYHKRVGFLTTHNDPQGRPNIFQTLPTTLPRVISIGRLDINSEGLLLLTNDGQLARKMELPRTGLTRTYKARVYGLVKKSALAELKRGITVGKVHYGPIHAHLDRQVGANAWLSIALKEGKNREIRHALATINLRVNRLIRVSYGQFSLGSLAPGTLHEVIGMDKKLPYGSQ